MISTGWGCSPGDRAIDVGAGAGRHSFEMYRRGADVIAFDQDADELANVLDLFGAMKEAGEVPEGASADIKEGDALALPFADGEFDRVIASEILEHIPADIQAIDELVRVLRPGGTMAITVPRWLPEIVCWKLSDDYHNTPGGHIRIYSDKELIGKLENAGMEFESIDYAHGLHSPYWWLKCAVGVKNDDNPLVKAYHQVLVWDIMKTPRYSTVTRLAEKILNPVIGKSMVLYLRKPESSAHGMTPGQIAQTAASIASMQEADGAIPWTIGEHTDAWNHVEGAMALLVGGEVAAAEAAYEWCLRTQRADGSWPMKLVSGHRSRTPAPRPTWPPTSPSASCTTGRSAVIASSSIACGRSYAARSTWSSTCSCRSAASPGRASGMPTDRPRSTARHCSPAAPASTRRCAAVWRSPRSWTSRSPSGSSPAAVWATPCASTVTSSSTSRRSRWTGTTRCSAAPSAEQPPTRCWPRVGTPSSRTASASAASARTPG